MKTMAELVREAYTLRPCFICGVRGLCDHREYRVEEAYILAEQDRHRAQRPQPVIITKEKKRA